MSTKEAPVENNAMKLESFKSPEQIGERITKDIVSGILTTQNPRYILGLPTGETPKPIIKSLLEKINGMSDDQKKLVADRLHIVVMDDFLKKDSNENIDSSDEHSAVGFMKTNVVEPLNKLLKGHQLGLDRVLYPQAGKVSELKETIKKLGGIDLQIMATDPYEGYVAQNFANEPADKTEEQRVGNLNPNFLKHHPWASVYRGVTFSLKDFADMVNANKNGKFALVIFGEAKKDTLKKFVDAKGYKPDLPVSFLWGEPGKTTIYTDQTINLNQRL